MKRSFLILLSIFICLSFSACSGKQEQGTEQTPAASPSGEPTASAEETPETTPVGTPSPTPAVAATLPPSSNHTIVTEEKAPKFYWALDKAYHLEGCKELKGKSYQEIPWDTLVQLGLDQCPVCNPPRYK